MTGNPSAKPRFINRLSECPEEDCVCNCISCAWHNTHHAVGQPTVRYFLSEDRKDGMTPSCEWAPPGGDKCGYPITAGLINGVPHCGICMSAELSPLVPQEPIYKRQTAFHATPKWRVISTTVVAVKEQKKDEPPKPDTAQQKLA